MFEVGVNNGMSGGSGAGEIILGAGAGGVLGAYFLTTPVFIIEVVSVFGCKLIMLI